MARPFLKWAGGKHQLFEQLGRFVPKSFGAYYEPFVGGGAVFFALRHRPAFLSDVNEELMLCYRAIRDQVDEVIRALDRHTYDRKHFYEVRDLDPEHLSIPERVARTIFLNKTAFNGLYRVNSKGKFNVPFGRHRDPLICDRDTLRACSAALEGVWIDSLDFTAATASAKAGDFVYFDPPYVPKSDTSYFTSYVPGGFGWDSQEKLAALFDTLTRRKVKVMLSNSDVPALRKLYAKHRIETVTATRRINSRVEARGPIDEIVVLNYQPGK
ncbi:MAG TPA: DNA adenine methylase [Polyangiaceae bacterium]